ncbi:MAG: hypothetical protein RIG63_02950 [Coleofasciculus chthonoplastes F3-SA18-01]|uniref:hypothetical protein n=1 Tax=Coleofasciculus chthonoplastes TaxID=64178 RepID=UPI0032F71A6B
MRQLLIQVPRGQGDKVLDMAKAHQGTNLARFEASDTEGKLDFVIAYVPNRQVEQLLEALDTLHRRDADCTLCRTGYEYRDRNGTRRFIFT